MDKSIPLFMSLGGDGNTRFDFLFKQTNTQAIGNQVQFIGSPNKPGSISPISNVIRHHHSYFTGQSLTWPHLSPRDKSTILTFFPEEGKLESFGRQH